MNTLDNIKKSYNDIKSIPENDEGRKITSLFSFEKLLLSDNSQETLNFQYNCLKDTSDWNLYICCRSAFKKRGELSELFIFNKIREEEDPHLIGDCIHILGTLRSIHALSLALKYMQSYDTYIRKICLYVIGWIGNESHIPLLEKHLLNEKPYKLRITAGSAMRQIFWRISDASIEILKSLKKAFYAEEDITVKSRLIELISTISGKNLGIREDKNDPDILIGDVEKAIKKTDKFLGSI